ncbi:T9SS type B sorting domain-containing protein [Brumimicrobium aurantiacum]|uniref:PKD domain-containing protein n=1 Tax=Brumimicrobium aurantiacum TaxID=1737063 RepID=A0A3E1F2G7_9FLAO|nr:gliding motility-associated C-terminal domain-containing protein [Brumimicrobium aurantiacum]RFC55907.1 PKD domain-containing protein [Brumimicrobium aurantiacum]
MNKLILIALVFTSTMLNAQISPGGVGTVDLTSWFRADDLAVGDVTSWTTQFPAGAGAVTVTDGQAPYPQLELTPTGAISNYNRTINFSGNTFAGQNLTTVQGLGNANPPALLSNAYATDEGSYFCAYMLPTPASINHHITLYNDGNTGLQVRNLGANSRIALGKLPSNSTNAVRNYSDGNIPNIVSYKGNRSNSTSMKAYNRSDLIPTPIGASQSSGSDGLYIGYHPSIGTSAYNGFIHEVIFFDRDLTDIEMQKVETYLAIKYGTTLIHNPTNNSGDYLATDGTIIWDASNAPAFHNDVIGIGRDDVEDLNQKQSHSFDDSVRIYIDALVQANENNLGTINTDLSYVTMGHNGGFLCGSPTGNSEAPAPVTSRLEREFKITNTNFNQDFNIDFIIDTCNSIAGIDPTNIRLMIDTDDDFSNATLYAQGGGLTFSVASGTLTVTGLSTAHIPMNDTRFMTIGYVDESYTISDSSGPICIGEEGWVVFQVNNSTTPIDVEYTDGVTTTVINGVETGDTLFWTPNSTTTYDFTPLSSLINCCSANGPQPFTQVVNPLPTITLDPFNDTICIGENVTLTANGANTYVWDNGVQNGVPFQVNTTTTYEVTATDVNGCVNTLDTNVVTKNPPSVTPPNQVFEACDTDLNVDLFSFLDPANDATGTWYDPQGNPIPGGQLDVSNLAGIEQYDYVLSSTYCPSDTGFFDLDVKTFLSAGNDFTEQFCNDGNVDLNNFVSVANPGSWTSMDGLAGNVFNPNTGILVLDGLAKGDYTFEYVVVSDAPCSSDTAVGTIQVSEMAQIQFTSDVLEGCSPLTVNFSDMTIVDGAKDYIWYVDGAQVGTDSTMTYVFDEVRCYDITLSIETDNLCLNTHTESQMICVNPDPIAEFKYSPTSIFSDNPVVNFTNESQLNANNIWDFAEEGVSNEVNPSFTFPFGEEGDYEVTLTVVSAKGCIDSTTQIIPIRDQTIYYVPNAFTPDGDNINNVFKPVMTVGVDPQLYKFEVFNRWGEKVFESNDYNIGWDGTYGDQLVADGMYNWKITFTELKTELVITQMGTVVLIK